eukprot:10899882-Lingulodinium_polyedra.AAC.1
MENLLHGTGPATSWARCSRTRRARSSGPHGLHGTRRTWRISAAFAPNVASSTGARATLPT